MTYFIDVKIERSDIHLQMSMKLTPEFAQERPPQSKKLELTDVLEQIDRHAEFRRGIATLTDFIAARDAMSVSVDDYAETADVFRSGERRRFWAAYIRLSEMLLRCKPFRKMKQKKALARVQKLLFNFEEFRIRIYHEREEHCYDEMPFTFLDYDEWGGLPKIVKKFTKKMDDTGPRVISEIANRL